MSDQPLRSLLRRVRRRLIGQTFIACLLPCLAGSLAAVALWFVVQPLLLLDLSLDVKWGVAAALLGMGLIAAFTQTWRRAPGLITTALALDNKFDLKERITTFLTLSPAQLDTPAGQALRADVDRQIARLELAGKFPLQVSWSRFLLPGAAAVLALASCFFEPFWQVSGSPNKTIPAATAQEIKNQLDNLKKVSLPKLNEGLQKEELRELENAWEKLVKQPAPKTKDEIRERVKEMRDLQDKLQDRIKRMKDLAARNKDVKSQLQTDPQGVKEMKELEDALAKGKLNKAVETLERLAKKLDDKKLSKEEQQKLAEQLKDLQEKLERLAEQKDQKEKLQREFEEGKISKEELQREMDRLAQEAENLKELQALADLLGQCRGCLGKSGAAGKLRELQARLKAIELTEEELRDLLENQDQLEGACEALLKGLNVCEGNCEGDCEGLFDNLGKGRRPGGRRPVGEEPKDSKIVNARQHAESDPKGQHHITGFSKGGTFSRIPAAQVGGAFKQAVQDAPDALDRQRIPADASDMAKGYFKNLGGQK